MNLIIVESILNNVHIMYTFCQIYNIIIKLIEEKTN